MLNFEKLLFPIQGDAPTGADLSFSREIDAIVEARRFDDSSLDQGEWVVDVKTSDWAFVLAQCTSLIEKQSKDLRLAVWLTEANAKINHFEGLAQGFALITGMLDLYWEGLFPSGSDGDFEQRIGNLHWVLARTQQLAMELPLTEGRETSFSLTDFEFARGKELSSEKAGAENDANRSEAKNRLVQLESAKRKSSKAFYEKLMKDTKQCVTGLALMEASVDRRLGLNGPSFAAARDALETVVLTVARFAQEVGIKTPNSLEVQSQVEGDENVLSSRNAITSHPNAPRGAIQSRADAIARLREVAEFFRQTEPHSPVAYLAEKAASWGEMSLHSWLTTVLKDPTSLAQIEEMLGVSMPPTRAIIN